MRSHDLDDRSRIRLFYAAGAIALLLAPSISLACSICRCGDTTFNALGKDGYSVVGFRGALDWERFDKTEGNPSEESESQVEHRSSLLLSYGLSDRLTLLGRVPYSVRTLTGGAPGEEAETLHTDGFSDPELYGQMIVWSSHLQGDLGRRASLSLKAGVKPPWGRNDLQRQGERLDEHAQPGTGSTDLSGGIAFLYLIDPHSALFVSSLYRHTGENSYGYRYGSSLLVNVAGEHKVTGDLDGVVELNFRHAQRDRVDATGALDEDTGGSLLYVTPRLLFSLPGGVVLRLASQIPVVRDLNGFQKERPVFDAGLTYLWRR